jgi:hypothetical protein
MRGFIAGSLALIALEVLTRRGAVSGVEAGGNALVRILDRAMSPDVPLIPNLAPAAPERTTALAPRFSNGIVA